MKELIILAKAHVTRLLNDKLDTDFVYHNLAHTQSVVDKCYEIADFIELKEHELELLILSAWFHDTGHIVKSIGHEEESVKIATGFLEAHQVSEDDIQLVSDIILATKIENSPNTLLEEIIRDADCAYIGSDYFETISQLLKREWELTLNKNFTDEEWVEENIKFLTKVHSFHTDVAITKWQKVKDRNLSRLA